MTKDRNDDSNASEDKQPDNKEASNDKNDSGAADYKRDEDKRGEGPDNLRRRSEWFQKRTGGG